MAKIKESTSSSSSLSSQAQEPVTLHPEYPATGEAQKYWTKFSRHSAAPRPLYHGILKLLSWPLNTALNLYGLISPILQERRLAHNKHMAYLALTILVIGFSVLLLQQVAGMEMLPQWLRPAKRRDEDDRQDRKAKRIPNGHVEQSNHESNDDELSEHESTPKALASNGPLEVPAFSLSEHSTAEGVSGETEEAAPSFPAANSAQRVQANTLAISPQKNAPTLMPPPPRPNLKPPMSAASALRVPSTGPLPNRGLPANSAQRVSGGLSPNGAPPTPKPRGKVLLAPGHSPMDWAALTRRGNLSGVNTFQRVTPSVLKSMTGRKGKPAWSSWHGKVYNLTPYLPFHPGGEAEIMKAAGRDGKRLFEEVHPWVNWENMLGTCLVGVMVPEDYGQASEGRSSLEDID